MAKTSLLQQLNENLCSENCAAYCAISTLLHGGDSCMRNLLPGEHTQIVFRSVIYERCFHSLYHNARTLGGVLPFPYQHTHVCRDDFWASPCFPARVCE
jgi:hypothetical protein